MLRSLFAWYNTKMNKNYNENKNKHAIRKSKKTGTRKWTHVAIILQEVCRKLMMLVEVVGGEYDTNSVRCSLTPKSYNE